MTNSLKNRIIILCVGLVLLTTMVSLFSFWWSTSEFNEKKVTQDINVAENVYKQYLSAKQSLLLTAAKVLTSDFGFKQAVATRDADTISSVLYNHSQRINADLMLLLDLSGKLISSNTPQQNFSNDLVQLMSELLNNSEQSNFVVLNNELYQVILLPVKAPRTVAYSLVGFKIDESVVLELKNLTGLDVSFIAKGDDLVRSSLLERPVPFIPTEYFHKKTTSRIFGEQLVYRNRDLSLPSLNQHSVNVMLSADLTQSYSEFERLFFTLMFLAAITIVIGIFTSSLLAKNLTMPLSQLASLARQFARGNYSVDAMSKKQSSEISTLIDAFKNMGNDIQEREQQISFAAKHDTLTGFYNRSAMLEVLNEQLNKDREYTLVAIDIRGLRHINDKLGPRIGDDCLKAVAGRIAEFSDEFGGLHARIGGDEFLTVFPSDGSQNFKNDIVGLMAQLQACYTIQKLKINLRFSTGVVQYPAQGLKADDLIRRVLIAVDNGENAHESIHYYQAGEDEEHLERLVMIDELKQAIADDDGQLFMTYQPKLNIASQKIDKVESLIRWQQKDGRWISPELFIDLAEQSGLIVELTEWVIKTVIKQVEQWQKNGIYMQAAINVSAQDIAYPGFHSNLVSTLKNYSVAPALITIELTERDMIENEEKGIQALENLKAIGVKISLDDYGVGQTSLGRLKMLPIDELKLDKCFILKLDESEKDQFIVESTITLGHQLGFSVVAEGVETAGSLELLKSMKCDHVQGYYLSRPLKADVFEQWLKEFNNEHA
ncbi:diguanylate phosphodiesterase [Pseudoalteromonas porphyrae]|uniref:bifunctional diguanylate cyclase/phosphodiesterase n=1 Tax=Pseudoalteromonas TaxID=53246 RepID=UPI0006BB37AA|nr:MULTISPECIES: EAL domain-containing protein [Pseudoalteromonas]KPH96549.1 diguanylate phosphodiesterase [Pseudoalteromonas porphyrae]NNG44512.1 EAL domain-containing protein [Pseudoalteromonas sp. NEC-BIFX-2020_002]